MIDVSVFHVGNVDSRNTTVITKNSKICIPWKRHKNAACWTWDWFTCSNFSLHFWSLLACCRPWKWHQAYRGQGKLREYFAKSYVWANLNTAQRNKFKGLNLFSCRKYPKNYLKPLESAKVCLILCGYYWSQFKKPICAMCKGASKKSMAQKMLFCLTKISAQILLHILSYNF